MLEGHVEKPAFGLAHPPVIVPLDGRLGNRQRQMVGREAVGVIAKHVARELVEQDHRRQRFPRGAEEALSRLGALLPPKVLEPLADERVEAVVPPPLYRRQPEPEIEDLVSPVFHDHVTAHPSSSRAPSPSRYFMPVYPMPVNTVASAPSRSASPRAPTPSTPADVRDNPPPPPP